MKYDIVKITPNKAAIYLKQNPKNREVDPNHVSYLAEQMLNGEWLENGQTIVISKTGDLVDGQHRLQAIIESGVTLELLVITGVDDVVIHTIDSGKARKLGDIFHMEGHSYCSNKASMASSLYKWKKKNLHSQSGGVWKNGAPSLDILYKQYMSHEKAADEAVKLANCNADLFFMSRGDVALAYFLIKKNYKGKADEFFKLITDGGDYAKSPTHALPTFIHKRKRDPLAIRYRKEDFYLILHCFEEWIAGNEMSTITDGRLKKIIGGAPNFYPNYKMS